MPAAARELYCILIPIGEGKVLIPRNIVEEVRALGEPTPVKGAPPWCLGTVRWHHQMIPLTAVEPLAGISLPPLSRRARMIVVRTPSDSLEPPAIALLAQGFPYILRVTPELVSPGGEMVRAEGLLTEVGLGLERPLVPDIPAIASRLAGLLAAA